MADGFLGALGLEGLADRKKKLESAAGLGQVPVAKKPAAPVVDKAAEKAKADAKKLADAKAQAAFEARLNAELRPENRVNPLIAAAKAKAAAEKKGK